MNTLKFAVVALVAALTPIAQLQAGCSFTRYEGENGAIWTCVSSDGKRAIMTDNLRAACDFLHENC